MLKEFQDRDTEIMAIANEDTSEEDFVKIFPKLGRKPYSIHVGGDIGYDQTRAYDRVHLYYINKQGIVDQVFPMEIYSRAPWWAILNEIDRIQGK